MKIPHGLGREGTGYPVSVDFTKFNFITEKRYFTLLNDRVEPVEIKVR